MNYPPIFLCAFLAVAGYLGIQQSIKDGVIPAENAEFSGIVQDMRLTRAGWQRLVVLAPEGINKGDLQLARPGAQILTFLSPEFRLEIGQRLWLSGELQELEWSRNPGGYNEFIVQRARGIACKFYAGDAQLFEVQMNLARSSHAIRKRLAAVYNTVLPYREASLMQSIVLGERPDMDDPIVEMYRMAGIYHLLVVSGLHLAILMMAICLVFEKFMNRRIAGIIALALMIAYTLLTGASISTVRSVTMAALVVFGRLLYRDHDSIASVSFACIVLLLYEPLYLFSVGFQLSFGTVFGFVLLTEPCERVLAMLGVPPYKKFRPFLAYSIVGCVSTYPIIAYHFARLSIYSIFVNIIVMPTASLLVIVGLLVGLIGLFSITAAFFLAGSIYYLLQFYESVMRIFLSLPSAVWLVGSWGLWVTLAALGFMLLFSYTFSSFGEDFIRRKKLLAFAALVLVFVIAFEAIASRRIQLTSLDTGQGESYVLRAGGYTFVMDGGGNNRLLGMNTGTMVLMPYLDHRGVAQANGAFVSDASRGRITGLIELTMANRVQALYIPAGLNIDSGLGMRLRMAAERNSIPIRKLSSGDIIQAGNLTFTVAAETPRLKLHVIYQGNEFWLPTEG